MSQLRNIRPLPQAGHFNRLPRQMSVVREGRFEGGALEVIMRRVRQFDAWENKLLWFVTTIANGCYLSCQTIGARLGC